MIPETATAAVRIHAHGYHYISAIPGTVAGAASLLGLLMFMHRRRPVRRVAVKTSYVDLVVYGLLLYLMVSGDADTGGPQRAGLGRRL